MKIGITERGDASIDYSWVDKLSKVDGAILITKNVTDKFIEAVLPHRNKVIVHATTTGYGGTPVEPNVMPYHKTLEQLKKLEKEGFSLNRIVLRVDPIIPTKKGIRLAEDVITSGYAIGLRRFRISVIDMYPHVRERFQKAGLPLPYGDNFTASDIQFADVDALVKNLMMQMSDISIECCAEPRLKSPAKTGCISNFDLQLLGLKPEEEVKTGYQRHECLCLSCKTELLNNKFRCRNGCLYCYWRDKNN